VSWREATHRSRLTRHDQLVVGIAIDLVETTAVTAGRTWATWPDRLRRGFVIVASIATIASSSRVAAVRNGRRWRGVSNGDVLRGGTLIGGRARLQEPDGPLARREERQATPLWIELGSQHEDPRGWQSSSAAPGSRFHVPDRRASRVLVIGLGGGPLAIASASSRTARHRRRAHQDAVAMPAEASANR